MHIFLRKYLNILLKIFIYFRQNGTGYTPFMEAARQGHEGVFSAFLDYVSMTYCLK